MKILVVDDEKLLVKGITFNLQNEGYEVEAAYDGVTAVDLARRESFDLIILDWMMPGKSGSEACMEIRTFSDVPVIMLTAKSEDSDKIMGFACGADDYVTKPFSPLELVARVKAQLRRYEKSSGAGEAAAGEIIAGALYLNHNTYTAISSGNTIELTTKEFEILWFLASSPGQVFSKEQIYQGVWGYEGIADENSVTVYINRIREKLGRSEATYIKTVWGAGYKFSEVSG